MSYGKFKMDWKNFFLGFGVMALCLILPFTSDFFSNVLTNIRNATPWAKKD